MRDPERLGQLARQLGAYEREPLPRVEPPRRDSIATSPVDTQDATAKLELQRTSSAYYKDPSKQKVRNLLRSKNKKAALNDRSTWSFTKAERFAELDQQIRKGGAVGVAQALLIIEPADPFDVNGSYAADQEGNAVSTGKPNGWLDLVAARNDVNHVRLLTAFGASQEVKDQALGVALERKATGAVQELLRNNANPNATGAEFFMNAIKEQDMQLIHIFLTSIKPMQPSHINDALISSVGRDNPDLVALLIAHGASGDYAGGQALRNAIVSEQLEDTATILLHFNGLLSDASLSSATEDACSVRNETIKQRMLEMLLFAGADPDTPTIQNQLLEAVKSNQRQFAELLIRHGVSQDRNGAETLRLAIASGQMELVTVLLQGPVSQQSLSGALQEAAALDVVDQYEYVVTALVEKGVPKDSLHKCLAEAVSKTCGPSLAPMLIENGATLDYDDAQCVRSALKQNNFSLLQTLLKGSCEPSRLCKVLPDAMAIEDRSERFHVMNSLLEKGVSGRELHVALRTSVSDAKDTTDFQLIGLLIQKNASVDFTDSAGNCVCIAAARGDERVLDLLENGDPSPTTASAALGYLPVSFAKAEPADYEKTVHMARLLLRKGASGTPAAEMLIKAVRDDYRGKALDLLLTHEANANYQNGKSIEEALRLPSIDALEQLCRRSKLEKNTFATQLPNALKPKGFSMQKATLLAHASSKYNYPGVLDKPLLEEIQVNGSRKEVVELLLGLKASVNFQNGEALRHAVSKGDVETTRLLLAAKPTTANVARAFPATMQIRDRTTRYALVQALLNNGGPGMGDEALIQASREASPQDLSLVVLLLEHKATPNFRDGAAVLESVKAKNLPLLDLFISTNPNKTTLTNAFNAARKVKCSREERHRIFSSLLKAPFKGYDTSQAMVEVVQLNPTDIETSVLLLDHGASVDHAKGQALRTVATAGSLQLMNIFISKRPNQISRDAAFVGATATSLDVDARKAVYLALLETKISRDLISAALLAATHHKTVDKELLSLLIKFNASLDFKDGNAVYNVTTRGDGETLRTLLTGAVTQKKTLDRSFSGCAALKGEARHAIAKQLLEKKPGVNTSVISHHLAQIVKENDHKLLSLLMEYKPDPSYNSAESFVLAAQAGDAVSTATLAKATIPKQALNRAFESMLDHRTIQSKPDGLKTASILCSLGVKQDLLDRALLDGFDDPIDQKTKDLVELLIPFKPNFSGDGGKVFVVAACSKETELFKRMASQKPDFNVVIPSLVLAFQGQADDAETEEEEVADESKQDVKANGPKQDVKIDGPKQAVKVDGPKQAVKVDGPKQVVKVDQPKPSMKVHVEEVKDEEDGKLNAAEDGVPPAETKVEKPKDGELTGEKMEEPAEEKEPQKKLTTEERLVEFLQHLEDCGERGDTPLQDSVLFSAMEGFPNGKILLKYLLDHGCPANSKIDADVDLSGKLLRLESPGGTEKLTALIWVLTNEEPVISEDLALEIMQRDESAEIAFETPVTQQTAATLASAAGRNVVLGELIRIGIDPSRRDKEDKSASFYASRNGHKEAVELLHAADARVNDSSLQEAAREGHFEIVKFLLANGHRADFPSGLHANGVFGRTALEELCLNAVPGEDVDDWKKRMHECIKQLLPKKGDEVGKTGGKTIIHFAVENLNPLPVTRAILDFPAVWESINGPVHLFQDGEEYFYSPTKYVEHFCAAATPQTRAALISLLRENKCEDKFYAHTVIQPRGAVGLPEDIAFAVDKQKRADHEHSEAVKRQKDLVARQRATDAEDHHRRTAADKERHERLMRAQREREEDEKAIAKRKQAASRSAAQELERDRQAAVKEESRLRVNAMHEEATRRHEIQDAQQAAELRHKQNLANQEYAAMKLRLDMESQIISDRDRASQAEAARVMEVLKARRATAEYEANQRASRNSGYN